jgi:hypothetical protein
VDSNIFVFLAEKLLNNVLVGVLVGAYIGYKLDAEKEKRWFRKREIAMRHAICGELAKNISLLSQGCVDTAELFHFWDASKALVCEYAPEDAMRYSVWVNEVIMCLYHFNLAGKEITLPCSPDVIDNGKALLDSLQKRLRIEPPASYTWTARQKDS